MHTHKHKHIRQKQQSDIDDSHFFHLQMHFVPTCKHTNLYEQIYWQYFFRSNSMQSIENYLCLPPGLLSLFFYVDCLLFKNKDHLLDSLLCNLNKLQYVVFLFDFVLAFSSIIIKSYKLSHQSQQLAHKLQTLCSHTVILPMPPLRLQRMMAKHFGMISCSLFEWNTSTKMVFDYCPRSIFPTRAAEDDATVCQGSHQPM